MGQITIKANFLFINFINAHLAFRARALTGTARGMDIGGGFLGDTELTPISSHWDS